MTRATDMFLRIAALAVAIVLAFPVIGTAQTRPIVVGAALSLTGPMAHEGLLMREGYDFWMHYVNGHGGISVGGRLYPVEIRYADDQSDPAITVRQIESLITDQHVDFMLGPYGSPATIAASAVVEKHGMPMVDSAGAAERGFNQGYRYTFGVLSPAHKYLVGILEFAVRRQPRPQTVAIVAASDPFSLEVQQGAVQSANDHGIRVVYADHYTGDPASVSAAVSAIKAARPDIILNAGHLADAEQMQHELKAQHVVAAIYGYSLGPDTPHFRTTLGADAQAVMGSAQWSPAVTYKGAAGFYPTARAYTNAFVNEYHHDPDFHNAEGSAAGLALQYAISNAGTLDHEAVRNALAALDVVTFYGLIKFDSRGVNVYKPMVVTQIQGSKLVTIYPYRLADAKPIYPAPGWGQ